ncbi:DUF6134 family protein [Reyranella soli]|uniref:Uncharacterized protein n=1 Tax=Reyranella soli TaxID=1230389 RepID=A0A512N918_9HYPH|nr:DUF6134 family protein [Reyranella soli]GEP55479.1 hypothetical protein RSO01_26450 [Reyranella soli]
MFRLVAALCLAIAGGVAAAGAQDQPYGPTLTFAVYRNGEPIGRHTLAFQHNGSDLTVSTTIDFGVKVMGITAYRYTHRGQENWTGDAFQSAFTQTDDNGTKYTVRAQRTANGIDVQRPSGREVMPPGTLPTSHWNVRQIGQTTLFNTQNGSQMHFHVTPLGREKVKTATGWVDANHYRYSGDVNKDQWFDDSGRWVKTVFKASDGSTIEYILQE